MSLSASFKASLRGLFETVLDLGSAQFPVDLQAAAAFTNGTGLGAADLIFTDTRTLAASATENLDCAGGGLTTPLGAAFTCARLKGVLIRCPSTNPHDLVFSRPAANGVPIFEAASDAVRVKPGGWFAMAAPDAAGWVVTAGTGDLLTATNGGGGGAISYDVVLIGASA